MSEAEGHIPESEPTTEKTLVILVPLAGNMEKNGRIEPTQIGKERLLAAKTIAMAVKEQDHDRKIEIRLSGKDTGKLGITEARAGYNYLQRDKDFDIQVRLGEEAVDTEGNADDFMKMQHELQETSESVEYVAISTRDHPLRLEEGMKRKGNKIPIQTVDARSVFPDISDRHGRYIDNTYTDTDYKKEDLRELGLRWISKNGLGRKGLRMLTEHNRKSINEAPPTTHPKESPAD